MTSSREQAARARSEGVRAPADRPRERRCAPDGGVGQVRFQARSAQRVQVERAGGGGTDDVVRFVGYASVTDTPYTMWDFFGEYEEEVTAGAFEATLAADPLTEFVVNHGRGGQIPMAHTRNGTLRMIEDDEGLRVEADLDARRTDVADLGLAVERGDVAEMSFRFQIVRGRWSDSFDTYFIHEVDLHRGDVSPVNFGANPHTHIDAPARSDAAAGELARDESPAADAPADDLPAEPTTTPERSATMSDATTVELSAEVVEPTPAQVREDHRVEELEARVASLLEAQEVRRNAEEAQSMTPTTRAYDQVARVGAESRTYTRERDPRHRGAHFLTDVAAAFRGDFMARDRLERHMREEHVERGDGQLTRATSTVNFTGWVVPQYLVDLNAPAAVAGRAFADVCNSHDLPETGMTVYLSKVTTGTSAADQSAENATVDETDMDDTQVPIPVRTAAGSQTISRQSMERGTGVDDVVFADLLKRYNKNLDSNVLNAATSGLTNVATSITYTDASPTAAKLYPKIQEAASGAEGVFLDTVDGLVVVMAPRRWRWLSSQMTSTWPFVSGPGAPAQSGAASTGILSESGPIRGYLPDGTPVVTDANALTNLGAGTNQDEVYVVAPEEAHLWEDPNAPMLIRAETNPKKLQLDLVLYGYYAFYLDRYAGGHRKIGGTGLVTPAFA